MRVGRLYYHNTVTDETVRDNKLWDDLVFFSFVHDDDPCMVWLPRFASLCITDVRWRIEDAIRGDISIMCKGYKILRSQESAELLPHGVKILDKDNAFRDGTQDKPYKVRFTSG